MNAVEKIEEFNRFGSKLGLERMTELMDRLGNPQDGLRYIHVAGTNGKGSVCRYIYEALRANDYKVGLYTSPFLEVFNERIEFDGGYITDEELAEITETVLSHVKAMTDAGFESPTEFEVVTAIAFVYFAKKKADFVVLEVGLGGRGDSTNIIKEPLVSIITSISYDHMDRLGDTLAKIAGEKAGIIKPGCPVVSNVKDHEAAAVIARRAYELGCVLYDATKNKYGNTFRDLEGSKFTTMLYGTDYSDVEISMLGEHQIENCMTALTALEILRRARIIKVERTKLYAGLNRAKQIGRLEIMQREPYIILDGAHNEDGTRALKDAAAKYFPGGRILVACGMLRDKDTRAIVSNLAAFATDFVITQPNNPRALEAAELAKLIEGIGGTCSFSGSPTEICDYVREHMNEYDAVIFAGSLYLIGEIRGVIKQWH